MLHRLVRWIKADDLLKLVKQRKMHPIEAHQKVHDRVLIQIIIIGSIFIALSQLLLTYITQGN